MENFKESTTYDLYLVTLKRYKDVQITYSNMEVLFRNKNMEAKEFERYKKMYEEAAENLRTVITFFSDEEKQIIIYDLLGINKK